MLIRFPPHGDMSPRTRKTTRKSTGPIGVPRHQLAPRHEDNSSGSSDPIGDLEAQVEHLRAELRHRNEVWVEDGQRINELRTDHSFMTPQHEACRSLYRDFFTGLKDYGYCIKCVFLTGITKFTQISYTPPGSPQRRPTGRAGFR